MGMNDDVVMCHWKPGSNCTVQNDIDLMMLSFQGAI